MKAAGAFAAVAGLATVSLLAFSLGYTAVVFAVGVFGGDPFARLRRRSFEAPRAAGGALLLIAGGAWILTRLRWI